MLYSTLRSQKFLSNFQPNGNFLLDVRVYGYISGTRAILTPSHGMNNKEGLQTVTVFCSFPQFFNNMLLVLTSIHIVTHSPENRRFFNMLPFYFSANINMPSFELICISIRFKYKQDDKWKLSWSRWFALPSPQLAKAKAG